MRYVRAALALPGYWLVTALAFVWGALLGGFRVTRRGGATVSPSSPCTSPPGATHCAIGSRSRPGWKTVDTAGAHHPHTALPLRRMKPLRMRPLPLSPQGQ
jgi:hypothetical protein